MEKFNAAIFRTLPDLTTREHFKHKVENILHQVRGLTPVLRVGWLRQDPYLLAIAPDLDAVGCMSILWSVALYRLQTPYDDTTIAVHPGMTLREYIASWEARDGAASANVAYPGCIIRGCEMLGWIAEPDDNDAEIYW